MLHRRAKRVRARQYAARNRDPSPSRLKAQARYASPAGAVSTAPRSVDYLSLGSSDRSNLVRTDIPSRAVGRIPAWDKPVRADILSQAAGRIPA
jgi:hypothetical protein